MNKYHLGYSNEFVEKIAKTKVCLFILFEKLWASRCNTASQYASCYGKNTDILRPTRQNQLFDLGSKYFRRDFFQL